MLWELLQSLVIGMLFRRAEDGEDEGYTASNSRTAVKGTAKETETGSCQYAGYLLRMLLSVDWLTMLC